MTVTPTQPLPVPSRELRSYRHELFLRHGPHDFVAGAAAVIEEGLEVGEPIRVAVNAEHTEWLHDALQGQSDRVEFLDLRTLGHHPARMIPVWQQFVNAATGPLGPARGITEPLWSSGRPEEIVECELDEALLNLAVAPDTPLWLLCSYDADALGPTGRAAAEVTHPIIVESGTSSGSVHYVGRTWVEVLSSTALPDSAAVRHESVFTTGIVARLLSYVRLELYVCGLTVDRAMQLATATNGLALGSSGEARPR